MAVRVLILTLFLGAITVECHLHYTSHELRSKRGVDEIPHMSSDLLNPNKIFGSLFNGIYDKIVGIKENGKLHDSLNMKPPGPFGDELSLMFGQGGMAPRGNGGPDSNYNYQKDYNRVGNSGSILDKTSNSLDQVSTKQRTLSESGDISNVKHDSNTQNNVNTQIPILRQPNEINFNTKNELSDVSNRFNVEITVPNESKSQDVSNSSSGKVHDYQNSIGIQNDLLDGKNQSNVNIVVKVLEKAIDKDFRVVPNVANILENGQIHIDSQKSDVTGNDNSFIGVAHNTGAVKIKIPVNTFEKGGEAQQNPNFDTNEPKESKLESKNEEKGRAIKDDTGLNGIVANNLAQGLNIQTNSDLNVDIKKESDSQGHHKMDSGFNTDARTNGLLIVNTQLQNNRPDVGVNKYQDFIVFPDDISNVKAERVTTIADSQLQSLPNRVADVNNDQYLLGVNIPTSSGSNQVPTTASQLPNNVQSQWIIPNNMQTIPVTITNNGGQNTNQYTNPPNADIVNLQNQNQNVGYVNIASTPNGGASTDYTLVTVPTNANSNFGQIYVSNNVPASFGGQATSSGYYYPATSAQTYYTVQLTNGQTLLVPVNNGRPLVSRNEPINVVPWNNAKSVITQNNGQVQYVALDGRNVIQVPNGQGIVQIPANGQLYQIIEPNNNPSGNLVALANPGNVISTATTSNVAPLLISYKDKVDSEKSTI